MGPTADPTPPARPRHLRLIELAAVLILLGAGIAGALAGFGIAPFHAHAAAREETSGSSSAIPAHGTTTFDGDWQTGDNSQWSGLECPDPGRQFRVVEAPGRAGVFASRYEVQPGDVWAGNGSVRCLDARYDTGEGAGEEHWFGLSVYIPSPGVGDALLWELHHPASLYELPGCGVAPFALLADKGSLVMRIAGGDCLIGSGWRTWHPAVPLPGFAPYPRDTWIDVVVHIRFTERPQGLVEVWARRGGAAWPARPLIRRSGIPTLPYSTQAGVHDVRLYTEVGLYKGGASISGTEVAYLSGYRRASSFAGAATGTGPSAGSAVLAGTGPGLRGGRLSAAPALAAPSEAQAAARLLQGRRQAAGSG